MDWIEWQQIGEPAQEEKDKKWNRQTLLPFFGEWLIISPQKNRKRL